LEKISKDMMDLASPSRNQIPALVLVRKVRVGALHPAEPPVGKGRLGESTSSTPATLIILMRLLLLKLIAYKPLEIAEFGRTVSQADLAAVKAILQLQALQRAKDATR
jgi:hypothetical protein